MATPLRHRRVVITRSEADNVSLAAGLGALGAQVVELPLVEVVAPADGGRALQAAVDRLVDYRFVILTSANGVQAVAQALGDQPWPDGVVVIPVGPVTAYKAAAAGMIVGRAPSAATVTCLVEEFPAWTEPEPCPVLAPLAELADDTVVDGLTARGYVVDRCEAYRTVSPSSSLTSGLPGELQSGVDGVDAADAVLFFSPSAVDRFVNLLDSASPDGTTINPPELAICIGPSTAARATAARAAEVRAMDRHGWDVVVAETHTEAGVIEALVSALS